MAQRICDIPPYSHLAHPLSPSDHPCDATNLVTIRSPLRQTSSPSDHPCDATNLVTIRSPLRCDKPRHHQITLAMRQTLFIFRLNMILTMSETLNSEPYYAQTLGMASPVGFYRFGSGFGSADVVSYASHPCCHLPDDNNLLPIHFGLRPMLSCSGSFCLSFTQRSVSRFARFARLLHDEYWLR
jgi:hypothetical protein